MSRRVWWVVAILCFAGALVIGWLAQPDFKALHDHHERVIIEVVAMIVLGAPLLVLLRRRRYD